MGKILAFTNQKGGVGKTTSAANVGAGLAKKGNKVLLVDLDHQANLTTGLGQKDAKYTVWSAIIDPHPLKAYPISDNLALVAGTPALSSFETRKGDDVDREYILKDLLAPLKDKFDFIILDCPPSLGLITINAYSCADRLYIPLEAQQYAVDGLTKVIELVDRIKKRINPNLEIGGIFFTRFSFHKVLRRDTMANIRETYPGMVLDTAIRDNIALGEAPHAGQDIFTYAPKSPGASDYDHLIQEITSKY